MVDEGPAQPSPGTSWHRLHGSTVLIELVKLIKSWAIPIGIVVFVGASAEEFPWWMKVALVAAALSAMAAVVRYFTLRYGLDGDRLVIRSGLIFRQMRTIPVNTVQNLHLKSGVLHRMFRVVEVRVETAGSGESEAHLSVVLRTEAETFRAEVLARRTEGFLEREQAESDLVRRSTVWELLVAGATENRITVLLAAIWGIYELLGDVGAEDADIVDFIPESLVEQAPIPAVVALVVVAIFFAGWIASIVWALISYHGFVLHRSGGDLRKRHGLLTRFETAIPVARVQVLRLESSWLRRLLAYTMVKVETAGTPSDDHQGGTTILCPILPHREADPFCQVVFPDLAPTRTELHRVHPLARRRGFVRLVLPGLALMAFVVHELESPWTWLGFPAVILLTWLFALARFRILGYALDGRFLVARAGVITRKLWVVPQEKIQQVKVTTDPIQRWLGIATLTLATAGGGPLSRVRVPDMGQKEADSLFETLSRAAARGGAMGGL